MMKKFLTAMLGSIAGFWISLIILGITFFVFIIAVAGSSADSGVTLSDKGILHLKLSGEIVERERPIESVYDLQLYNENTMSYNDIVKAIMLAKDDKNINGIFIDCMGASLGVASRQEITQAIKEFKKTNKWVYAYADNYTQGDYYIACEADSLYLNPVGSVDIHGLSATTMFFKGLMDKIGVEAQIVKVGTYKSAVEPFILTQMSDASREQQKHYLGNIWSSISGDIAKSRGVNAPKVNQWADSLVFTHSPESYLSEKIVDRLCYRHQVEQLMRDQLSLKEKEELNFIIPKDYLATSKALDLSAVNDHIAILFATGDIVDTGNGGIVGTEMVPEILKLAKNEKVKGLILRVNSGGGSAFASEQIWDALEQFKKTGKPFYVSMGDVAASGGYYISCGADKIYAEPTTLTGSIGIFGIIPNAKQLMSDNLGITTDNVSTNLNGDLPSFINPMTTQQKNQMQNYVERGYETFVTRCANGRGVSVGSIKKIAEGRVWDGISAKEIGLVDEFGGLQAAITDMKKVTGLDNTLDYPIYEPNLFAQLLASGQLSEVKVMPAEIGEFKEYFMLINRIKSMSHIQCKMEDIVIY